MVRAVQDVMAPVGYSIYKRADRMNEALDKVLALKAQVPTLAAADPHYLAACHVAESMVLGAEMFYRASLARAESRGWHLREDFPKRDDANFLKWIELRDEGGEMAEARGEQFARSNPDLVRSMVLAFALPLVLLVFFGYAITWDVNHIRMAVVDLDHGARARALVDAFRAGARGVFFLSESSFKSLCRCVEQVHAGQIWASSAELSEVMDAFTQLAPMRVVNADGMSLLTKREEDVVRLLAEGLQNREIAKELKLSEHTVKNYLFHIFDKLGVSSRVELALYAVSSSKRAQSAGSRSNKLASEPASPEARARWRSTR